MLEREYTICFPSRGRQSKLSTLSFIPEQAQPLTYIGVDSREADAYRKAVPMDVMVFILLDDCPIGMVRNRLVQFALDEPRVNRKRWLFMLDDDHTGLYKRKGLTAGGHPHLEKCLWDEVAGAMLNYARYNNVQMLGLSQRQSNHNYNEATYHPVAKISDFYLLDLDWLRRNSINYDIHYTHFEDFQLNLEILKRGGKTGLFLPYAFDHALMGSNAGGFQENGRDRQGMAAESLNLLMQAHPRYVNVRKGRVFTEPAVDWAAIRTKGYQP